MAKKAPTTTKGRTDGPENDVVCVDLFCGAGGLTHGLIDAGVKVKAGVDFDKACKFPYEENHPGIKFHGGDVAKLDAATVREWFGDATVRVLAGCAPCQPFSNYALRYQKDEPVEEDKRWRLLDEFGRLVEELMPEIVTMENVPTVTKHPPFKNFEAKLNKLGYTVWYDDNVDCAKYGLPQRRHRTVLLASLYGEIKLRSPEESEGRTVRDVLKDPDLEPIRHGGTSKTDRLHTASRLSDLNYQRITVSKPGGTWRDWPPELRADCHKKKSGKTYPSVYGRMTWDEPAPTLTTQFYGFGNGRFGHPTQRRGLSLREGAILQGFPKDYKFIPDDAEIQFKALGRMIGNAVPVDLGRVIGESIIEHVVQHRDAFSKNVKNVDRPSSSAKHRRGRNDDREHEGSAVVR
ncbi:MAG TPA: DNA cytosine methyltransferase [Thermoanaerobaculales bacterium]|jgi:DNA (cytosine-5)-methyltransferase 1|nr:DNA cytosine methyltransferase [Sedimentisphaerales bacterium]HPA81288.1 DNA cytosine methyltransferase [Thermoanaerobaculales bacterium]